MQFFLPPLKGAGHLRKKDASSVNAPVVKMPKRGFSRDQPPDAL